MKCVLLRDRLWAVEAEKDLGGGRWLFQIRDRLTGEASEALCPPESYAVVTSALPEFQREMLTPFRTWSRRHEAFQYASTANLSLAAIHAGRILPEAYQFVPAARLLEAPRPSLLIADDVGLGKTIEAGICLMELMARGRARRILLVVPPGLIPQWVDEIREKFGLSFDTIENATGLTRAQTALAEGIKPWNFLERVITSVDYLKRRDVLHGAFERPWDVIIVDEAHALAESGSPRNPYTTQRTRLGQKLREAARTLILLTATPHNGYRHAFRSLLELVAPTDATFEGERDVVNRRVGRSMVRRLKAQIHRTDPNGRIGPAFQPREPVRGIKVEALSKLDTDIFKLVSGYCAKVAKAAAGTDQEDLVSFAMQIVKKRMLSSRAALSATVDNRLEALSARGDVEEPPSRAEIRELQSDLPLGETEHERIARKLVRSALPKEARRRNEEKTRLKTIRALLNKAEGTPDAKLAALADEIRTKVLSIPGEKAIIFTEYVDTLAALAAYLDSQPDFRGITASLRGGLGTRKRLAALNLFAKAETRLLLATDAASEGLNLQEHCRRLYHLELPWNPIRLEQRNGRIDRHGQKRPPKIAYFFYPTSPEDRMLDRLVSRIIRMQDDKVSTPDILGLLSEGRIERALGEIDAEETDASNQQREESLFRVFEEEREDFVREMAPLLVAADPVRFRDGIADPYSADPLVPNDTDFAGLMRHMLGSALQPAGIADVFSLHTPSHLQGAAVLPRYHGITFLRSVAIETPPDDVEFVHRYHPLARAVFDDALRRLTLPTQHGRAGERLAARRHPAARETGPYVVFMFLAAQNPPDGDLIRVAIRPDKTILDAYRESAALDQSMTADEVSWSDIDATFSIGFEALGETAFAEAKIRIEETLIARRNKRSETAVILREDAGRYRTDRLAEIEREQKLAEAAEERATAQILLFEQRESTGFKARRAAVDTFHRRRMEEIDVYVRGEEQPPLHPLGAVFIFPV